MQYWSLILLTFFLNGVFSERINITYFGNCDDVLVPEEFWPIRLTNIEFEANPDGLIDTIHGKYEVKTNDDIDDRELFITTYNCPIGTTARCNMNRQHFTEDLNCDKFHQEGSGVWRVISRGIKGSDCGQKIGTYELNYAKLLQSDIEKYLIDKVDSKYRIFMLFHRKGENLGNLFIRGCVDLEFDIFF